MSVISDRIKDELERRAGEVEVQPDRPSSVEAGDRFVVKLEVPASMDVELEPEVPFDPVPKTHTVRKGETLSAIARQHDTSWQKLAQINKLEDPDLLRIGQVLTLPSEDGDGDSTSSSVTVPITSSKVTWKVEREPSNDAQEGEDYIRKEPEPTRRGNVWEHTVSMLLAPAVVAQRVPPARPARWRLKPEVHLTAQTDEVPELAALGEERQTATTDLDALSVAVGALEVPSVLAAFSEVGYNLSKDGGRLVVVPTDVPVPNLDGLIATLNSVQKTIAKLKGLVGLAGLFTGLGNGLSTLLKAIEVPAGSPHKLYFKSVNETRDLGKGFAPEWRHRRFQDDHGAEDDIDSLLLVSLDQRLELYEDQDFKDKKVDVAPSTSQFWIGIPDFHNIRKFTPSDGKVRASVTNFSDEAHSFRLRPRAFLQR